MRVKFIATVAAIGALAATLTARPGDVSGQTPKRGGSIVHAYEGGEPPNYDCHGSLAIVVLQFVAPHYSLLLRYSTTGYPRIEGDLAESWTVAPDGLTYTFKLRPNVKFHDGSPLTSTDIKATYDRIRNPGAGVVSVRKADFADVSAIETPDPQTVVFHLSRPNSGMLANFANPFNCVYSDARLRADPSYPANTIMGSGPFTLVEHAKGQSWTGKRFADYFRPGQPYLDDFKLLILAAGRGPTAFAGGQLDMFLRTMTPQEIETVRANRGDKATFVTGPILVNLLFGFNVSRKPFDDVRVRRALTLAIDRRGNLDSLARIINIRSWGSITRPGSEIALPEEELSRSPGFGADIAAARAEARRLLAEAGQSGLKLKILTRSINPYSTMGVFVADQLRQIGVTAELDTLEGGPYVNAQTSGNFDAMIDVNGLPSEDPTTLLTKFLPGAGGNFGRYSDATLTDVYERLKVELDPAARRRLVNDFERRVLDQAYYAPMFWAGWTSVVANYVHGWLQTPSYFVGHDMGAIWRD